MTLGGINNEQSDYGHTYMYRYHVFERLISLHLHLALWGLTQETDWRHLDFRSTTPLNSIFMISIPPPPSCHPRALLNASYFYLCGTQVVT